MDKYTVVNPDDGIVFIIKLSNHSNTQRILKYLSLNERSQFEEATYSMIQVI